MNGRLAPCHKNLDKMIFIKKPTGRNNMISFFLTNTYWQSGFSLIKAHFSTLYTKQHTAQCGTVNSKFVAIFETSHLASACGITMADPTCDTGVKKQETLATNSMIGLLACGFLVAGDRRCLLNIKRRLFYESKAGYKQWTDWDDLWPLVTQQLIWRWFSRYRPLTSRLSANICVHLPPLKQT